MQTLNERLRKLEQITTHGFEVEENASKPVDIPPAGSTTRKKRPARQESAPLDLEGHLQERIEYEKRQHRSQELSKLQEHFLEGVMKSGYGTCRKVQFAVEYCEVNASKIALLMGTVSSSDFKRTLCLSLVSGLTDIPENFLVDLIDTIVSLKFPKLVVRLELPEPEKIEAEPEPEVSKSKKGFFSKKK